MDAKRHLLCLLRFSLLIILLLKCTAINGNFPPTLAADYEESARVILNTTSDIVQDTNIRLKKLTYVRYDNFRTPPYEIGYINYVLYEKYRRMIDLYNSSSVYVRNLYIHELLIYLEELEHLYWDIEHLANMVHEVERKYGVPQGFDHQYNESLTTKFKFTGHPEVFKYTRRLKKKKKQKAEKLASKFLLSTPRPPPNRPWSWPLEYGWEVDYIWF